MPWDDLLSQALGNPALQQGAAKTLEALVDVGTTQAEERQRQQRALFAAGVGMLGGAPNAYGAALPAIQRGLATGVEEYGRLEDRDLKVREEALDRQLKAQIYAAQNAAVLGKLGESRRHNLIAERLQRERNEIQAKSATNSQQRNSAFQFGMDPNTGQPYVFDRMTGALGAPNPQTDILPMDQFRAQGQRARMGMAGTPGAVSQEPYQQQAPMPQAAPQQVEPTYEEEPQVAVPPVSSNRAIVQPPPGAAPGTLQPGRYRVIAPQGEQEYGEPYAGDVGDTPGTGLFGGKRETKYGKNVQGQITGTPVNPRTGAPAGPTQIIAEDVPETKQKEYDTAIRVRGLIRGNLLPKLRRMEGTSVWSVFANQKLYAAQSPALMALAEQAGIKNEEIQNVLSTAGQIAVQMGHVYAGSRLGIQLLKWFNKHVPNDQDTFDQMRIKAKSMDEGLLDSIINSAERGNVGDFEGEFLKGKDLGLMLDVDGNEVELNISGNPRRKKTIPAMTYVEARRGQLAQAWVASHKGKKLSAEVLDAFYDQAYQEAQSMAQAQGLHVLAPDMMATEEDKAQEIRNLFPNAPELLDE